MVWSFEEKGKRGLREPELGLVQNSLWQKLPWRDVLLKEGRWVFLTQARYYDRGRVWMQVCRDKKIWPWT